MLISVLLCTGLKWKIGDLVWGKFMNWPWWPAIVFGHRSGHCKDSDSVQLLFGLWVKKLICMLDMPLAN